MSWLNLNVDHKCPYCNSENHVLKYYAISEESSFIDVGDYIPNNLDTDIGFITAGGYCEACKKTLSMQSGCQKVKINGNSYIRKLEEERC